MNQQGACNEAKHNVSAFARRLLIHFILDEHERVVQAMASSAKSNPRFTTDVREETNRMLQPIAGYEKEPLLPLRDACRPLRDMFGSELNDNISYALAKSASPKDGLTVDESAAIYLYSMEWENSLYTILNRTLRAANRGELLPWYRYLKLFLTAFYKLP